MLRDVSSRLVNHLSDLVVLEPWFLLEGLVLGALAGLPARHRARGRTAPDGDRRASSRPSCPIAAGEGAQRPRRSTSDRQLTGDHRAASSTMGAGGEEEKDMLIRRETDGDADAIDLVHRAAFAPPAPGVEPVEVGLVARPPRR